MSTQFELNTAQRQAVEHDDGPLAVIAGPGSGKTAVLTRRIVRLIEAGVDPSSIVALTFTVKAAAQLRERLAGALSGAHAAAAEAVHAHTFHGLGHRLVKRFAASLGLPPDPEFIDGSQRLVLLGELITRHKLFKHLRAEGLKALCQEASQWLEVFDNKAIDAAAAVGHAERQLAALRSGRGTEAVDPAERRRAQAELERFGEMARLAGLYRAECRQRGWLSFGDLNTLPIGLLRSDAHAAAIVRGEFRHAVVDEFQDVNPAQVSMLAELFPAEGRPDVCVVGDDDQAIYGFRGADPMALERFRADYSPREIMLTENYRSQPPIIAAGNALIGRCVRRFRADKTIERARALAKQKPPPGAGVECVELTEFREDGEAIASMILADRGGDSPRPWSDFAVIARSHGDLARVEGALRMEGIPVAVQREGSALQDAGVQDVLAWCRVLADPTDCVSARRLLVRPPLLAPMVRIGAWERAYRAELHGAEPSGGEHPGPYSEFLARHAGPDRAAQRFAELERPLRHLAGHERADEVFAAVIALCSPADAELLPAAERAERIGRLVSVLRFVRQRQARLPAPGDIRAFFEYYDLLPEREQGFERDDRIDADVADDEAGGGGVTLITAHSAKGLEFDTVFVARVENRNGFPQRARGEPLALPEGLEPWRVPDAVAEHFDEERRLFYVACTRAERRLVVLGKASKSKDGKPSQTLNYFNELTEGPRPLGRLLRADDVTRSAATVRGRMRWAQSDFKSAQTRAAILARFKDHARATAAAALDRADAPDLSVKDLDAIAGQLRSAAARLGVAGALAGGGTVPAWLGSLGDADLARDAGTLREALHDFSKDAGGTSLRAVIGRLTGPLKPPLTLSYSQIWQYHKCPLCYYLRQVMRLPEAESSARSIGNLAHAALSEFYVEWRDADAEGRRPPERDRLLEIGRERLEQDAADGEALTPADRDELDAILRRAYDAFHDPTAHITEYIEKQIERPILVDGVAHKLIIKPDRVDDLGDGRYRIVDFKSGQSKKSLLKPDANDLQLGVYALGLDWVFGDKDKNPVGGKAEYWLLRTGERGELSLEDIDRDKVVAKIAEACRGMLKGEFMPAENCDGPCSVLLGPAVETA
ncbi:MAG: ATP-dependent helicase [Phycisphaeraceae bacterium]|nr:ATP-dependent helicase [Phycisphaeraceae bacterium]